METTNTKNRPEIVGIEFIGPEPIETMYWRNEVATHVFYGRNGAGKSRLLAGIGQSLSSDQLNNLSFRESGKRSATSIVIRLRDDSGLESRSRQLDGFRWRLISEILLLPDGEYPEETGNLSTDHSAEGADFRDADTKLVSTCELIRELVRRALQPMIETIQRESEEFDLGYESLVNEICADCVLVIECDVRRSDHWNVFIGFSSSESTPRLRALLERLTYLDGLYGSSGGNQPPPGRFDFESASDIASAFRSMHNEASNKPSWMPEFVIYLFGPIPGEELPVRLDPILESGDYESSIERSIHDLFFRIAHGLEAESRGELSVSNLSEQYLPFPIFAENSERANELAYPLALKPVVVTAIAVLESIANDVVKQVLIEPLELSLMISTNLNWIYSGFERPVSWRARDPRSADWIPILDLSEAQARWATFSIRIAHEYLVDAIESIAVEPVSDRFPLVGTSNSRQGRIVIIDEPERALHRRAERFLAEGLIELGERMGMTIIVATHSPEFLRDDRAIKYHVGRTSTGSVQATEFTPTMVKSDEILGINREDTLLLVRTVILVEGEHDLWVLREIIGDELDRARAVVAPMRGASRLATAVDAQLLIDYTDASVVVVLDNVNGERASSAWNQACDLAGTGDLENAIDVIRRSFDRRIAEEKFLSEFAIRCLGLGLQHRFRIQTLSKADILEYLDPSHFGGGSLTWEEIRKRHSSHDGTPIKKWMESTLGSDFSETTISRAAASCDSIHEDFTAILDACRM